MTGLAAWPPPVSRWFAAVELQLRPLPEAYRDDVLTGLREHIIDQFDAGVGAEAILVGLGEPQQVAADAFEQYRQEAGDDTTSGHPGAKTVLQWAAFLLAVAAVGATLFLPGYSEVTTTGDGGTVSVTTRTLLDTMGPAAVVLMLIPLALTGIPLLVRDRSRRPLSIGLTALLAVFAVLTSASVGWFFLPAALAAIVAMVVPDRRDAPLRRG